jgi:hypothetical protein
VLERAKIVHSLHTGRESLFAFDPEPMEGIKKRQHGPPEMKTLQFPVVD